TAASRGSSTRATRRAHSASPAAQTGVGTRAAWIVDLDTPLVLLAPDAERFALQLEAVGFASIGGYLAGEWRGPVETTPVLDPEGLARRLRRGEVILLDVREDDEWEEGHVEGSVHVPYHDLRDRLPELPRDGKALAVACSAGTR